MSDRLQDLLRQRALMEEHLAWLDREIETASAEQEDLDEADAPWPQEDTPPPVAPREGASPIPFPSPRPLSSFPSSVPKSLPASQASPASTSGGYLASQAAAIARHAANKSKAPPAAEEVNPHVVAAADAILEEYRVPPDTLKTDVRKGCLIYFFAAFVVLAVVVGGLWLLFKHNDAPAAHEPETKVEKRSEKD